MPGLRVAASELPDESLSLSVGISPPKLIDRFERRSQYHYKRSIAEVRIQWQTIFARAKEMRSRAQKCERSG